MAVITISRQFGAGGTTLGERLAKRLGYRYVNDEMIKAVAEKFGVSTRQVRDFEKRGTSKLMKLLDKIVSPDYIDRRLTPDRHAYLDERTYVEEVKSIILSLYEKGNVVIIGRGSNYALQGYENTVHILLVADLRHRIWFLVDKYQLTENEAERVINRADMIRDRFLNCFSLQESHNNPLFYTIVLNMNHISMEIAEEMVASLVRH